MVVILSSIFRYDKLYMGRDVFFFNDGTSRVEKLHQQLDPGNYQNAWTALTRETLDRKLSVYLDSINKGNFGQETISILGQH